jgi:hypothetical protein
MAAEGGSARAAVLPALLGGAALWVAGSAMAGWREAWDGPLYFPWLYLAALAVAGLLARRHPSHPVAIGFAVFGGQLLALFAMNPGGSLLPLGVVLFAVMALPAALVAKWAAGKGGKP